jgi:hypothetical protein
MRSEVMHSFERRLRWAIALFAAGPAWAQQPDLSWFTLDGGGQTFSTGGGYTLGGTIGQPDGQGAPIMNGGAFELTGGFWAAAPSVCGRMADVNQDGLVNGADIQYFSACLVTGASNGANCACADLDGGGVGPSDAALFVAALLSP